MSATGRSKRRADDEEDETLVLPQPASVTPPGPALERQAVQALFADAEREGMWVGATYYVINFKWWQLWQHYVRWNEALNKQEQQQQQQQQQSSEGRQRPGPIDNTELLEDSTTANTSSEGETGQSTATSEDEEAESDDKENEEVTKDDKNIQSVQSKKDGEPTSHGEELQLRRGLVKDVDYTLFPASVFKLIYSWYGCSPVVGRQVITVGIFQKLQVELHPIVLRCCNKSGTSHSTHLRGVRENRFSITAALKDVRRSVAGMYMLPPHKSKLYLAVNNDMDKLRLLEESVLNQTLEDLGITSGQIIVLQSAGIELSDRAYTSYPTPRTSSWNYSPIGNTVGKPLIRGATGLHNLGNTCFMNSALQCLSVTTPLLRFFLTNAHVSELNPNNPLGAKGELAKKFAELLQNLWSAKYTSVVPREFKSVLSKFAPQFAGYQQHDSQELLSFVLDGLHEDLNRIREKPYTEKLEFSPAADNNDVELAQLSWKTHLVRNDSVVVDHFHGQLKSTVVCQHCGHASLTFDPFVFLSVPVPSKNKRIINVVLFWRNQNPIKYGVRVSKMGTIKDLKNELAKLVDISPERLVMAEIYTFRPFKIPDAKPLFDIRSSDLIFAYEVLPPGAEVMVPEQEKKEKEDSRRRSEVVPGQPSTESMEETKATTSPSEQQSKNIDAAKVMPPHETMEVDVAPPQTEDSKSGDKGKETTPDAPAFKFVNQIAHVPVFHRKFYAAKKFELFGRPLIISFDRTSATNNDIHQMIFERVSRYVGLDLPSFNLSLVDSMGYGLGNEIPHNDELFVFDDANSGITVDWDRDVLHSIKVKGKEFEEHASLQKTEADEELCVTLEDCLSMFTSEELLEGSNPWYCSACKIHRPALKQINMWKCPPVLIIHLKRFQYTHVFREKVSTTVKFPTKGLGLSAYINHPDPDMPPIYDLYAVSGGHYTAFTKNPISKDWFKISDSNAVKVEKEENVVTDTAYMLFYINRAFYEQQGLEDIEAWIGAVDEQSAPVEAVADVEVGGRSNSQDRMDVVKAKEAESGFGERDAARGSAAARGRRNSDTDISDAGRVMEMEVYRMWNDGDRPDGGHAAGAHADDLPVGDSYMGAHRGDPRGVLDLVMQHSEHHTRQRALEQGSGAGNSRSRHDRGAGGGRGQLRSSLYVCPKCDQRVASLDDLQVHVLCNHPDSEELLAVFCG